ncbi:MAG TPA: Hsp70 family protein [Mycobacterium sp.]|nr:Hsp70 family protein [Mycobacterium sp.]
MADAATPAIGLSVGATTLVAVTSERAVTRRPVITLYRDHAPQVGVPSETSANPDDPGLVITDFVDRVGDAAPIVAGDESTHRPEQLLADGLHALTYATTGQRPPSSAVVVTHPAHWSITSVDALRTALNRVPEWSQQPVSLISDVAAALAVLRASPGLPADGIIAVCDFGGSGTNITLVDAARDYRIVGATVRHSGFSGDLIDQALLNHVVDDLTTGGSLDSTVAIGSLTGLRNQCRSAKEQLSTNTVTELNVDVPGFHGGIWLTRAELDGVIREPFDGFLTAVQEMLQRNRFQTDDLSAVATVGGGANIPAINTGLSQHLGVAVLSSPRPELAAALGAALEASQGSDVAAGEGALPAWVSAPASASAGSKPVIAPPAETEAFSAPAASGWAPFADGSTPAPEELSMPAAPRSEPPTEHEPGDYESGGYEPLPGGYESFPSGETGASVSWYRRPLPVILACAVAVLIAGVIAVLALRHAASTEPATPMITTDTTSATRLPSVPLEPPPPLLPSGELPGEPPVPPAEPPANPEIPTSESQMFPEIPTMLPPASPVPPPAPATPPEAPEAPPAP